ncbi:MAG TPA: hypothetical protein VMA95_22320, partial [Streptosporangiaceae bacterium]|nr:hypothetical protein [Streptosporangiaceae bacterium]
MRLTAPPAHPAPALLALDRPHMAHRRPGQLVPFHALDHRPLDPQQPSPYPAMTHAVHRPLFPTAVSHLGNQDGNGVP